MDFGGIPGMERPFFLPKSRGEEALPLTKFFRVLSFVLEGGRGLSTVAGYAYRQRLAAANRPIVPVQAEHLPAKL